MHKKKLAGTVNQKQYGKESYLIFFSFCISKLNGTCDYIFLNNVYIVLAYLKY